MNFGLHFDLPDPRDYIYGGTKVPLIPYRPSRSWKDALTTAERQAERFETCWCADFAILSQIETFLKGVYGRNDNFAEAFNAILIKLACPGTDPRKMYQSVRKDGVIDQEHLPMLDTFSATANPERVTGSLLAKGQFWLSQYEVSFEQLWDNRPDNWRDILKQALAFSPIAISVSAWREENGVYVNNGPNNHLTLCYEYEDLPKAFDTYPPFHKTLSADHSINRAYRIHIVRKDKRGARKQIGILKQILNLLLMKPTLLQICEANLGKDASPNDAAPDELGCADTVTTLLRQVYPQVPHLISTIQLNEWFKKSYSGFELVYDPQPEDVIVSPTNGKRIGHTGIFMGHNLIASNDSGLFIKNNKGKFLTNYTHTLWKERYQKQLGLSTFIWRKS